MTPEDTPVEVLHDRLKVFNMLRVEALRQSLHELASAYGASIVRIMNDIEGKV